MVGRCSGRHPAAIQADGRRPIRARSHVTAARQPVRHAPHAMTTHADPAASQSRPTGATPFTGLPHVELSVVVPVRNERANLAPLIHEILATLSGVLPFEIVYVDDGSTDGTVVALQRLQLQVPALRVLRHDRGTGQSSAIRTGVQVSRGRWIATLDGDGQNDPADIAALLTKACALATERGDERVLVAGWRTNRRDTPYKRLQSRVANRIRSRLLHDGTPDTGCGLKVFTRSLYLALPYFDHMHRFLPALVQREGGSVQSVPVNHRPRTYGRSHYGLLDRAWAGAVDMLGVIWLARRAQAADVTEVGGLSHTRIS